MSNDDTRRVELTPRQIRDLEAYDKVWRSEKSTDEERDDAAGQAMGYLRSALRKRS
jgi:hypothetical protein